MLRFGIISEIGEGENLGFARVSFDDTGLVSPWLALPSTNTQLTKHWLPVAVNSQVACVMDAYSEQGFIAMVLWSATDRPPMWADKDTYGVQFCDGTEIYYNAGNNKLTVNAPGADLNITCKNLNITGEVNIKGDTHVTGEVSATVEVSAGMNKIKLTDHVHPTPAGVSGLPNSV